MYSGIFSKLDWYTCMFQNCSIYDVLNIFGLQFDVDIAEIFANHYTSSKGYSSDITFDFAGLNIKTDIRDIFNALHTDDVDLLTADEFFGTKLNSIRLDISGQGLDWVRSQGIVPETFFRAPFILAEGQSYHVTRCDFAFDFLDTHQNFLNDLTDLCYELDTGNGVYCGAGRPQKYEVHKGNSNFTLYLGSNRSNKRLRVYDKHLQFEYSNKLIVDHPYYDESDNTIPNSWIRIELQTRNDVSRFLLNNTLTSLEVLRYIYDNFQMQEAKSHKVSDVWLNLWDWNKIPSIIQNENSVALYIDPLKRSERFIRGQSLLNLLTFVNAYGFNELRLLLELELQNLQISKLPSSKFRLRSLLLRMNDLKINHDDIIPHLRVIDGIIKYIEF